MDFNTKSWYEIMGGKKLDFKHILLDDKSFVFHFVTQGFFALKS